MKKQTIVLSVIVLSLILVFAVGCGKKSDPKPDSSQTQSAPVAQGSETEKIFSAEELAAFNGKDGQKAYIAVDGIVYDVTEVPFWKNGEHNGFTAGRELSEEIKTKSPHGVAKLKDLPVVGKLK